MKSISISKKLPAVIIFIGLVGVILMTVINKKMASDQLQSAAEQKLTAIVESRKAALAGYLDTLVEDIRSLRASPFTLKTMDAFSAGGSVRQGGVISQMA